MSPAARRLLPLLLLLAGGLGAIAFWLAAVADAEAGAEIERVDSEAAGYFAAWSAQRAYPNRTLPSAGYTAALAERRAMEAASRSVSEPWEPVGPHNIAGRMLAVALNPERPETVWAGSAGGGLWRSYSGGVGPSAWERVSTGFGVLAASAIAISPTDTSTLYLGTGEVYSYPDGTEGTEYHPLRGAYGIGILKTTDGGATWTQSLDWSMNQERGVQRIAIDPSDSETVWAATTEGVYVTRDGGVSWTLSLDVVMATDVSIDPASSGDVFAVAGNFASPGHGFYRTRNGGQSWARISQLGAYTGKASLARHPHPDSSSMIFASIGTGALTREDSIVVLFSGQGGGNWDTLQVMESASYGWLTNYIEVVPLEYSDLLYVAGTHIYRTVFQRWVPIEGFAPISSDMGTLPSYPPIGGPDSYFWSYVHADQYAMAARGDSMAYFATGGGIYRLQVLPEGVNRFESVNGGLQTAQFYNGLAVSPDADYALGGLQGNGSVRFDGTPRYRRVYGGDGGWAAIRPDDPSIAYVSGQRLRLQRSQNHGFAFSDISPPSPGGVVTAFVAPYALAPSDPDVLYAGRSIVYKSTDRGDTWSPTNGGTPVDPDNNPPIALAVSPTNANVVFVSTAPQRWEEEEEPPGPPRLFLTRDGGDTWQDVTAGLPDRFVTDIAVHPSDDAVAVVTLGGFGTPHIFRTADSGATWTDITGALPDVPASAVVFDPEAPTQLFVGNDVGVFRSLDGGATWEAFSDGLPDAVMAVDLVYSPSDRSLHVGTYGNGQYRVPLGAPPVASEEGTAPARFYLAQNAPNPFRSATTLTYELDAPAAVRLEVFDMAGRRVAVLADGPAEAGTHRVTFEARTLAAGVYVARLSTGTAEATRRMVLVR